MDDPALQQILIDYLKIDFCGQFEGSDLTTCITQIDTFMPRAFPPLIELLHHDETRFCVEVYGVC